MVLEGEQEAVINRGNGRSEIFYKPGDYEAFLDLSPERLAQTRGSVL